MSNLTQEEKDILCSAAKHEGRLLLFTTDSGEWYVDAGEKRLPEKQNPLASAKLREIVRSLVTQKLLRAEQPNEDGVYTVTVKGFEQCGVTK